MIWFQWISQGHWAAQRGNGNTGLHSLKSVQNFKMCRYSPTSSVLSSIEKNQSVPCPSYPPLSEPLSARPPTPSAHIFLIHHWYNLKNFALEYMELSPQNWLNKSMGHSVTHYIEQTEVAEEEPRYFVSDHAITNLNPSFLNAFFVKLKPHENKCLNFGSIYRPPIVHPDSTKCMLILKWCKGRWHWHHLRIQVKLSFWVTSIATGLIVLNQMTKTCLKAWTYLN